MPTRVYLVVFGGLVVLTALTVKVALVDIAPFNAVVAVGIAGVKATLVVLYFMHVRYGTPLTRIFAAAGFFWLAMLIVMTMGDFLTRDWVPEPAGWAPGGP